MTCRVVVVEDEPDIAALVEMLLKIRGCSVSVPSLEDIEHFETNIDWEQYDSVVLDLMLPNRSGIEILHWLRAHHPSLRVVVTTAMGKVPPLAADYVLRKPFDFETLYEAIHGHPTT